MEVMKKAKPQDIVYQYVKNQIIGKSMFPGNRIIEDDIIRETGTSRTSIRPALLRLKYEGLVEMIPNRGAFVTGFGDQDVADMYEMRKVYEVLAFEWAVERITPEELEESQGPGGADPALFPAGICDLEPHIPLVGGGGLRQQVL